MVNYALRSICPDWFAPVMLGLGAAVLFSSIAAGAAPDGKLTISVTDEESGEPLPVRMELRDPRDRPVRIRPAGATVAGDSFYFEGEVTLGLRRGAYSFLIEAGPEYLTRPGHFTIERHAEDSTDVTLTRKVDMGEEGWWAGDLDVQLSPETLPLQMRARGVNFVPVASVVNQHGRCLKLKAKPAAAEVETPPGDSTLAVGPWATLDLRRGGGLLSIGAEPAVDVCQWKADEPTHASAAAAEEAGGLVVALTPFAWDLPIWIAAGKLDAVQIINRHAQQNGVVDDEADGRPRDKTFFPAKLGNGRYGETIYHHLLNCGLQLPPTAGTGAGATYSPAILAGARRSGRAIATPVGLNRTYVHCGNAFTRDAWLQGLREGRVMVTNGPLLRTLVDGELPGYVFELYQGERREFEIALNLAFYEATKVDYLEIVQNGRSIYTVRLDEFAKQAGRLPRVEFDASGWFLIRAVTENPNLYQFASTAPYYVVSNHQPRISRSSVEFFLKWLDDSAAEFAENKPVLAEIDAARPYWEGLRQRANAE